MTDPYFDGVVRSAWKGGGGSTESFYVTIPRAMAKRLGLTRGAPVRVTLGLGAPADPQA